MGKKLLEAADFAESIKKLKPEKFELKNVSACASFPEAFMSFFSWNAVTAINFINSTAPAPLCQSHSLHHEKTGYVCPQTAALPPRVFPKNS